MNLLLLAPAIPTAQLAAGKGTPARTERGQQAGAEVGAGAETEAGGGNEAAANTVMKIITAKQQEGLAAGLGLTMSRKGSWSKSTEH